MKTKPKAGLVEWQPGTSRAWLAHRVLAVMSHDMDCLLTLSGGAPRATVSGKIVKVTPDHEPQQEVGKGGSTLLVWMAGRDEPVPMEQIVKVERAPDG